MTAQVSGQSAHLEMAGFFPTAVGGFTPRMADRYFTADTLFDLIDGGAEIYRALNVRQTVHRRYGHPEANDIIADIFDMGSAPDAYGAYHNDIREGENAGIGRESEYQGGSLNFWKDRYYVSVVALHETDHTAAAVRGIGQAVATAIPGDAQPPELTRYLPGDGLLAEQIYYFHDLQGLTRRYRLANGNLLLLGKETEGLLARYRTVSSGSNAAPPFVLLLVRYQSSGIAKKALERFGASQLPRSAGNGWTSSFRDGETLAVVLDAPSRESADGMIVAVRLLTQESKR